MDLFDWIDVIKKLKQENFTNKDIAEKIGWSETKVKDYSSLLKNIVAEVLKITKQYQNGRATEEVANASFNFTEGWFRNSGLYDIKPEYQLKLISNFIDDKFSWSKQKVQQESAKYKLWQQFEQIAELIYLIKNKTFSGILVLLYNINI